LGNHEQEKRTKPISASELMAQLNQDPEFVRRREQRDEQLKALEQRLTEAEWPLVTALNDAGVQVKSVWDLVNTKRAYPLAIPVLITHLRYPYPWRIREGIARALTTKIAGNDAYTALVRAFKQLPESQDNNQNEFKWALGNAISIVADKNNFDEIVDLVRDKRHGAARDMLVLRLPRLDPHKAVAVLIELLADDEVAGHAVTALPKLKAYEARKAIERLLNHGQPWVRKEAAKALAALGDETVQGAELRNQG
jgi:HEAT repeat protein